MLKPILTVKEASRHCMVSTETIRRWIKRNELKAYNTQGRGVIKIRREDFVKFIQERNILTVDLPPRPNGRTEFGDHESLDYKAEGR